MARTADEYAGTGTGDNAGASGSGGSVAGAVDPASLTGTGPGGGGDTGGDDYVRDAAGNVKRNKDGSPRKKRGRKPGAAKAATPHDLKASIDALTSMLAIGHSALAAVSATPELAINEDEARLLASASVPVLDMMDFAPDPRFVAVFGLIGAAAQVYGPRAVLIRMRKAEERAANMKRAQPSAREPGTTMPFGATEGMPN